MCVCGGGGGGGGAGASNAYKHKYKIQDNAVFKQKGLVFSDFSTQKYTLGTH